MLSRRPQPPRPDPDLVAELDELLDQEHSLRLELGLPVADPVPPRYRQQTTAEMSAPREPRRWSRTVAFIWVCGLLLLAANAWSLGVDEAVGGGTDDDPVLPVSAGSGKPSKHGRSAPTTPPPTGDVATPPPDAAGHPETTTRSPSADTGDRDPDDTDDIARPPTPTGPTLPDPTPTAKPNGDDIWRPDPDLPPGTEIQLGDDCSITVKIDGLDLTGACPALDLSRSSALPGILDDAR